MVLTYVGWQGAPVALFTPKTNKNGIPNDPQKPTITSGIRLGSPAMTTRGFKTEESVLTANLIADVLERPRDAANLAKVQALVATSPSAFRSMNARLTNQAVGYALRLRGIHVQSQMGVGDAERAVAQELVVAVELELSSHAFPLLDELAGAADYAEIVRLADETARERAYRLLETFALRLARRLGERFPSAERVRVAVTKANVPVAPHTDEATVEVTLGPGVA